MRIVNSDDMKIDELSSLGGLAAVEKILAEAATATDDGDYRRALRGFEQALEDTRRIFGDNNELTELRSEIANIHRLLDDQNQR